MTTRTLPQQTTSHPASQDRAALAPRITGMACRNCGLAQPLAIAYVCPACFGPLEVSYDYAVAAATFTKDAIAQRAPGIWRYLELLPVDAVPGRSLPVGSTPLLKAERLAPVLGVQRLLIKDDTRNPSLSFKDRAVAVAAERAVEFGVPALACASTGNLAGATAAAAAAVGLPAYVFIPADLEPAKVDHALAYGATVVPVMGTYDDVNRLCLEVADETGWGFVNINLRPFYAEGSKTLAYEIAEALGWRSPDVVVAPVASGAMFTRVARGFEELAELGLIERRPIRFVGGQAAGCAPVATAFELGSDVIEPVREPDTIVRSLAIGNPADGRYAVDLARSSGGSIEAIPDGATAAAIRDVARLEGIYPETAGGVTLGAVAAARRRGVIRDGDEVVALLTGNGLKTPDARTLGLAPGALEGGRAHPGEPGLAPVIRASLSAFEAWLEDGR
ncbi:MAG: threonine synthase [Chloroflexota bacterium]|nr:threonine synthase [Chloroflexota bacterium]MDH5244377.1 threonine synthase [Chloroflexota bacterium]